MRRQWLPHVCIIKTFETVPHDSVIRGFVEHNRLVDLHLRCVYEKYGIETLGISKMLWLEIYTSSRLKIDS